MLKRAKLITAFVTISLAIPISTVAQQLGDLRAAANADGILIGVLMDTIFWNSPGYTSTAGAAFNAVTTSNAMLWTRVQPNAPPAPYDFSSGDTVVNFVQSKGQSIKGHVLIDGNSTPSWVWNTDVRSTMTAHITAVVSRYKGKIAAWDVVNEAFNSDGTYKNNGFYQRLGPQYIDIAFQAARAADPNALLFYNDSGAEGINSQSNAVYSMVQSMLSRAIPINGVGLEMYKTDSRVPPNAQGLIANIQRLRALGLKVDMSELDIGLSDLNQQRSSFWDFTRVCLDYGCRAVIIGGVCDYERPSPDNPFLFDRNCAKKPAFTGAVQALQGVFWRTLSQSSNPWDHSITFIGFSQTSYFAEYNTPSWFTLYRSPTSALQPIYLCNVGTYDHFLSTSSTCEGQTMEGMYGYGYKAPGSGLIPIKRCLINGEHFHSRDPNCEGYTVEGTTFYSP